MATGNTDPLFFRYPNYEKELKLCSEFLNNYEDLLAVPDLIYGKKKYMTQLQEVYNGKRVLVEVLTEDLENYFSKQEYSSFLESIKTNTIRYQKLFYDAADDIQLTRTEPTPDIENFEDVLDNFRLNNLERKEGPKPPKDIMNALKRKFELVIVLGGPNSKKRITPLRHLKANLIGALVEVRATVVRVSEVKPLINIACYVCEDCGVEIYQQVSRKVYNPTIECPSNICQTNNSKGKVIPNFAVSKFIPFQELKVQETSDQTPMGSIPRSFTVHCRGTLTRQCVPGDIINLCGIFLPKVNDSQRAYKDILTHDTFIEACRITQEKRKYAELYLSQDMIRKFEEEAANENTSNKLSLSISPEIFGMEDVKKALLLQMVGGSTLTMDDGMKIRGDINIALIGDPGVAKSQLLKQIAHLTPRGVYTSGKGSSGAGLTAAVMRDEITNEIVLEGGALVLADMGVCCIDEFDKMEERDRTSIHEVMEQQTVSIAKAGITTTLNARTSILAAANPVYGRYNKAKSPHENINLPPSLLSRFDLIFILLDRPDGQLDFRMATHITYVHQNCAHPKSDQDLFDSEFLRGYIAYAKTFNPTISQDLHGHLIQKYCDKRQKIDGEQAKTTYSYTTPRTLLAVIRLSQAMAKLRFSNEVNKSDIEEALRLMEESQRSIIDQADDTNIYRQNAKKDPISQIYNLLLKECSNSDTRSVLYSVFERKAVNKHYNPSDLKKCIDKYQALDVLFYDKETDLITLIN